MKKTFLIKFDESQQKFDEIWPNNIFRFGTNRQIFDQKMFFDQIFGQITFFDEICRKSSNI